MKYFFPPSIKRQVGYGTRSDRPRCALVPFVAHLSVSMDYKETLGRELLDRKHPTSVLAQLLQQKVRPRARPPTSKKRCGRREKLV